MSLYIHTIALLSVVEPQCYPIAAEAEDAKVHAWEPTHALPRSTGKTKSHRKGIWLMTWEIGDKFFFFPSPDGLYGDAVSPVIRDQEISLPWNRLRPTQRYTPLCLLSCLPYLTPVSPYSYFPKTEHKLLLQALFSMKLRQRHLEIMKSGIKL